MSWGERSCKNSGCGHATFDTCNVDCPEYEWDGTPPDSVSHKQRAIVEFEFKREASVSQPMNRAERRANGWRGKKSRRMRA